LNRPWAHGSISGCICHRGDILRKRLFMIWAAIRWLPLMFLVSQGLEAPLVAHVSQPLKPIRVWTAKTTWYGGKFQGRRTASGEIYDMYAPTGASTDLPFGSLVRISNPRTHVSQLVRINDRGPFIDDREFDVSYLVACRLGILENGVSPMRVELLEVPKRP
jgi:rare lipoprotein A (RlpA)-like double-psi beta-barrel protein